MYHSGKSVRNVLLLAALRSGGLQLRTDTV